MLEKMESNVQPADQSNQFKDTRKWGPISF
jgi:hypothetical protein